MTNSTKPTSELLEVERKLYEILVTNIKHKNKFYKPSLGEPSKAPDRVGESPEIQALSKDLKKYHISWSVDESTKEIFISSEDESVDKASIDNEILEEVQKTTTANLEGKNYRAHFNEAQIEYIEQKIKSLKVNYWANIVVILASIGLAFVFPKFIMFFTIFSAITCISQAINVYTTNMYEKTLEQRR